MSSSSVIVSNTELQGSFEAFIASYIEAAPAGDISHQFGGEATTITGPAGVYLVHKASGRRGISFTTKLVTGDGVTFQHAYLTVGPRGRFTYEVDIDPTAFKLPEFVEHFSGPEGAQHFATPEAFLAHVRNVASYVQ